MAKFLNSAGISYFLEKLIKNSDDKLYLISPYLRFNQKIRQLLDDKNRMKRDIRIIYGKVELQAEESKWLNSMDSIRLLFCDNLHAKCYLNEKEAIITSMNLYDFSQQNNNEMGVYVTKEEDPQLYKDIYAEAESLIRISKSISISIEEKEKEDNNHPKVSPKTTTKNGHCIRCDAPIKLNPDYPLCDKCYKIWSKFSDPEYEEKYCHICGKTHKTSMKKPMCLPCFKEYAKG
jgi:phosphatidylserine/phosphatidylglycerophosphate/cardiolipin synthase-like enzyme